MTDNIDEITKVGSPIPKVELPIDYALGWRTSNTTSNFALNDPASWNQFETNSVSIEKTGADFSQINLQGGKSYKLVGFVALSDTQETKTFERRFQWWNVTKNTFVGAEGGIRSAGDADSGGGTGPAQAYVALNEDSIFELRCSYSNGEDVDGLNVGTSFSVEHLQNLKI